MNALLWIVYFATWIACAASAGLIGLVLGFIPGLIAVFCTAFVVLSLQTALQAVSRFLDPVWMPLGNFLLWLPGPITKAGVMIVRLCKVALPLSIIGLGVEGYWLVTGSSQSFGEWLYALPLTAFLSWRIIDIAKPSATGDQDGAALFAQKVQAASADH